MSSRYMHFYSNAYKHLEIFFFDTKMGNQVLNYSFENKQKNLGTRMVTNWEFECHDTQL